MAKPILVITLPEGVEADASLFNDDLLMDYHVIFNTKNASFEVLNSGVNACEPMDAKEEPEPQAAKEELTKEDALCMLIDYLGGHELPLTDVCVYRKPCQDYTLKYLLKVAYNL